MDNFTLCLTVVITGLVVVFTVLVLLICIIKIYSAAVSKGLKLAERRKNPKLLVAEKAQPGESESEPEYQAQSSGETEEIVAVIAAAVEAVYGDGAVEIKSIKKSNTPSSRPAWSMAGIYENTRPF